MCPLRGEEFLAGLGIPHLHGPAARAGAGQAVAVRAEGQAVGPSLDNVERERLLPGPQVPDLHGQVLSGSDQALVPGTERHAGDFTSVGLDGLDLFQGFGLDQPHHPVFAPNGQESAVATERRPVTDGPVIGVERGDRPPGSHVPHLHNIVRVHRDELPARRA